MRGIRIFTDVYAELHSQVTMLAKFDDSCSVTLVYLLITNHQITGSKYYSELVSPRLFQIA